MSDDAVVTAIAALRLRRQGTKAADSALIIPGPQGEQGPPGPTPEPVPWRLQVYRDQDGLIDHIIASPQQP